LRAEGEGHAAGSGGTGKASGATGAETPEATSKELEGRMHKLAAAEDYEAAAAVRDELSNLQVDDEAHVLLANAELYAAFSCRNLERMKALWLPASYVQCIHPYEKRASGYTDVCASWQRLFEVASTRRSIITAEDVRVVVRGATATVVCQEQVTSKVLKRPLRSMLATNIFRKVGTRWYLVHRHVSSLGDSALGAPLLDDQPTALDSPEASAMAWRFSQFAQMAQTMPGAKIIIHPNGNSRGFGDAEDEDFPDHLISAELGAGHSGHEDMSDEESMGSEEEDDLEDMLVDDGESAVESARDTVRALRRLRKEGRLTQQAKIQLMSEMLRTPGESMPERAHELLLVGADEDEKAAWDDFAALVIMEAKRIDARRAKASEAGEWRRSKGLGRGKGQRPSD